MPFLSSPDDNAGSWTVPTWYADKIKKDRAGKQTTGTGGTGTGGGVSDKDKISSEIPTGSLNYPDYIRMYNELAGLGTPAWMNSPSLNWWEHGVSGYGATPSINPNSWANQTGPQNNPNWNLGNYRGGATSYGPRTSPYNPFYTATGGDPMDWRRAIFGDEAGAAIISPQTLINDYYQSLFKVNNQSGGGGTGGGGGGYGGGKYRGGGGGAARAKPLWYTGLFQLNANR